MNAQPASASLSMLLCSIGRFVLKVASPLKIPVETCMGEGQLKCSTTGNASAGVCTYLGLKVDQPQNTDLGEGELCWGCWNCCFAAGRCWCWTRCPVMEAIAGAQAELGSD